MAESKGEKKGLIAIKQSAATRPAPAKPRTLPPWKVLLHNDPQNEMEYVVETITMLTHLPENEAQERMVEAHKKGVSLLLTTHKERAELYRDQFASRRLTVTIEPQ
jgi:ATP-dependent Clp protease adaptor protein ClpS